MQNVPYPNCLSINCGRYCDLNSQVKNEVTVGGEKLPVVCHACFDCSLGCVFFFADFFLGFNPTVLKDLLIFQSMDARHSINLWLSICGDGNMFNILEGELLSEMQTLDLKKRLLNSFQDLLAKD